MDKIAVLIPCYNESKTIAKVVSDCKQVLPEAVIYVYDNNSNDHTVEIAEKSGAVVRHEYQQGKGNVVRKMFADVDADVYVMIDGDDTYDIKCAPELINILHKEHLDMVIGSRKEVEKDCYRKGHRLGNMILTKLVQIFFNYDLADILSGYRVFSKRFVKTFPAQSSGFEIETELTIYALSARLPFKEIQTNYFARPQGSFSKLSSCKDGLKILKMIVTLIKEERPFLFFNLISLFLFIIGIVLVLPVIEEYIQTGLVPRFPTAILSMGIIICAVLSFFAGLILDAIAISKKENRRQNYLRY